MTKRIILILAATLLSSMFLSGIADDGKYREHVVKWYEDLSSISAKYGVPEDVIININKLESKKLSTRQKLLIPTSEKYWTAASSTKESGTGDDVDNTADTDTLVSHPTSRIKFALVMPLGKNRESNGNNMDFYSGALMAVRDLGSDGLDVRINVRDIDDPLAMTGIDENDFIIGPIQQNDMRKLLAFAGNVPVISPLDNRSGNTFGQEHRNFIQAAAAAESQYSEAFAWANDIFSKEENVKYIIVSSPFDRNTREEVEGIARNAGISYSVCETGVQGDIAEWEANSYAPEMGHNVVILAITNEAVLNNAIRNMDILSMQGNVTVFTGSKIRSYDTIPVENLHKAAIHALCPYYIDYSDERTLDFIHRYRALFNTEPSQFAFQGYDLVHFMVKSYSKYGINWKHLIGEDGSVDMLQTSFKMRRSSNGVLTNCGMKRVLYDSDCRVKLSK